MTTIRDVAKLAGVGVGTVSRTISGKGSVSEERRRRVEDAIRKLSFRPSSIAKSLSSKELGIIGLLLPHLGSAFFELILRTAESELRAHGKYFVVATGSGAEEEEASFNFLLARDCDGMLIFSNETTERRLIDLERRFERVAVMNPDGAGPRRQVFRVRSRRRRARGRAGADQGWPPERCRHFRPPGSTGRAPAPCGIS